MSFFAVLFALLAEQLKPLPRDNWVHEWLASWVHWTGRNFDAGEKHHVRVVWAVSVLLPAVAAVRPRAQRRVVVLPQPVGPQMRIRP